MISLLSANFSQNNLLKLLEKNNCCSREQFKVAVKQADNTNTPILEVLFETSGVKTEKLLAAFSEFFNVPAIELKGKVISHYVLTLLPKEVAEEHSVVIFKKCGQDIYIATTDPANEQIINFVKQKTRLTPKVFVTTPADIDYALMKYDSEIRQDFARLIKDSIDETLASHDPIEKMAEYVPIIRMVNIIIERALLQKASDIHFEPKVKSVSIRYRIDGLLKKIVELPREVLPPLVARLKLLANLKIDEHRLPQDGRFKFSFTNREVAIRTSIIPTLYGSKVVLRLLDTRETQFNLKALGLNSRDMVAVKQEINKPHGMVLVTGPTGSGKTTTLYTMLRLLNRERTNICTIEDPIEYGLDNVNQMQVNPAAGLTFATGLRSLLRQDPDILMVGEIRDRDTADIALNAAMTGHMVLSTLHTNDAFLVPQRLAEMGIQPFLISSVVNLLIGQRLVRTICRFCKSRAYSSPKLLERYNAFLNLKAVFSKLQHLGLLPTDQSLAKLRLYSGTGCRRCNYTGYLGRIGIYEVIKITPQLSAVILQNTSAEAIKAEAVKQGALTMTEDGLLKVFQGRTTFEEVLRVTRD